MTYEVLARKWRPQAFQDVIGQEHITQTLMNAIRTDRLAHAYLFGGPRGVGKTSVARILAKAINCEQGEPGIPCNNCSSCLQITDGSSVDVQEIDGASNRGIDEIRELRQNIRYMPSSSRYRIYIIDEVHMLTIHAFNGLLKSLEEPPSHVKFIFATTETHKVPVTILSRCQRFDFKRISPVLIIGQLEKIAYNESIRIQKSGLAVIAREAEGSMRDAESLLDQVVSFTGAEVEDRHVYEILGIIDRDIILEASRGIIQGSAKRCLDVVDQIYNYGYDIKEFYRSLMEQFRNLLISLVAPQDYLLEFSESEYEEMRRLGETAGTEKLQVLLNTMIGWEEKLRFTSHPRLVLETTLIKLCHIDDFLSFSDLLVKIDSLEKRLLAPKPTNPEPVRDRISGSADPMISGNHEDIRPGIDKAGSGRQGWDDFLTFLSSKSRAMFNVLKDWHFVKLSGNTLEIAKANQSFSSDYFDDKEKSDQLSNYCRDFFKQDIQINIMDNGQQTTPPKHTSEPGSSNQKAAVDTDLPPPVQEILEMFKGDAKEETAANGSGVQRSKGTS